MGDQLREIAALRAELAALRAETVRREELAPLLQEMERALLTIALNSGAAASPDGRERGL